MTSNGAVITPSSYVPAWKKLGLRLKFAKEDAIDTENHDKPKPNEKGELLERGTKRENLDQRSALKTGRLDGSSKKRRLLNNPRSNDDGADLMSGPDLSVRKNVDFMLETKDRPDAVNTPDSVKTQNRKNEKKTKQVVVTTGSGPTMTTASATRSSPPHATHILSYLTTFHEDRSTWKFRKNREKLLLKHVVSLEHVPTRYNEVLLTYLQGLKSEGAKHRIREAAERIIKADDNKRSEKGESPATAVPCDDGDNADNAAMPDSEEKYMNAIQYFKTALSNGKKEDLAGEPPQDMMRNADMRARLETRRRAELVLWAVDGLVSLQRLNNDSINSTLSSSKKPHCLQHERARGEGSVVKGSPASEKQNQKKRKNRTAVVEFSSGSESENESSSEFYESSSDDSDDNNNIGEAL